MEHSQTIHYRRLPFVPLPHRCGKGGWQCGVGCPKHMIDALIAAVIPESVGKVENQAGGTPTVTVPGDLKEE